MVWSSDFSQCIRKEQEEEYSSDIEISNSDCSTEFNDDVIENNEVVGIVSNKKNAYMTFDKELERCINQIQYVVTKDTLSPLDPFLGSNQSKGLGSCDIASKTTYDIDTLLYDAIYDALVYDDSSLRNKFGVSISLPNRHPLWMNVMICVLILRVVRPFQFMTYCIIVCLIMNYLLDINTTLGIIEKNIMDILPCLWTMEIV